MNPYENFKTNCCDLMAYKLPIIDVKIVELMFMFVMVMILSGSAHAATVTYGSNQTAVVKQGATKLADVQLLTPLVNNVFTTCDPYTCSLDFDIVPAVSLTTNASLRFIGRWQNSSKNTISFNDMQIYNTIPVLTTIPVYQITLMNRTDANGTIVYWNNTVQNGTKAISINETDWHIFSDSGFTFVSGQHYKIRMNYKRTSQNDTVDLVPSLFGVDFAEWGYWNTSWGWAATVCFNSTASTTLTNFPVRAEINTSNATLFAAGNCSNVRWISTDNTTVLKYDIDDSVFCNSSVYNMTYYVQIPSLPSTGYCANLYLGNLGASSGIDRSMWTDAGYSRVMHFANGTYCNYDSVYGTTYSNFTCSIQTPKAGWTPSYAMTSTSTGAYESHFISPGSSLSVLGISALLIINASDHQTLGGAYTADYKGGWSLGVRIYCPLQTFGFEWQGGINDPICDTGTFTNNTWYYMGGMRNNATNGSLYRNGAYVNGSSANVGSTAPTPDFALGNANPMTAAYKWSGYYDEVRIHNATRTDDWFKAETSQTWTVGTAGVPPVNYTNIAVTAPLNTTYLTNYTSLTFNLDTSDASAACTQNLSGAYTYLGVITNATTRTFNLTGLEHNVQYTINVNCSNGTLMNTSNTVYFTTLHFNETAIGYSAYVFETNVSAYNSTIATMAGINGTRSWLNWSGTNYTSTFASNYSNVSYLIPSLVAVNNTAKAFNWIYEIEYNNGTKANYTGPAYSQNEYWAYFPSVYSLTSDVIENDPMNFSLIIFNPIQVATLQANVTFNNTNYNMTNATATSYWNSTIAPTIATSSQTFTSNASLNVTYGGLTFYRNSSNANITVYQLNLTNCTNATGYILNYSALDEDYLTTINPFSMSSIIKVRTTSTTNASFYREYNFTSTNASWYAFCISPTNWTVSVTADLSYTATGYGTRAGTFYYTGLNITSPANTTLYLLNLSSGGYYTITVLGLYGKGIGNATVTIYKAGTLMSSATTNGDGVAPFYLKSMLPYNLTINATGYDTYSGTYTPAPTSPNTNIYLNYSGLPGTGTLFDNIWDDIDINFTPERTWQNASFVINYLIFSNHSILTHYNMSVISIYNNTRTTVFNLTLTNASGGFLNYTATLMNRTYLVTYCFNATGYGGWCSNAAFVFYNSTGLDIISISFGEAISGWAYCFIAVFCCFIVAAFISQYTMEGAGAMAIILFWGFTAFNPWTLVVGPIQMWHIATLTSVVLLGGYAAKMYV